MEADYMKARMLIADDNIQGIELLEAYLDELGCEVKQVSQGEQIVKEAKAWKPDLILLDVMMPKVSGFEVCRSLRADEALKNVGIIMVTALDQPADIERAVEAGTDDFLTKPIQKAELLLRVKALLQAKGTTGGVERTVHYFETVEQLAKSK